MTTTGKYWYIDIATIKAYASVWRVQLKEEDVVWLATKMGNTNIVLFGTGNIQGLIRLKINTKNTFDRIKNILHMWRDNTHYANLSFKEFTEMIDL